MKSLTQNSCFSYCIILLLCMFIVGCQDHYKVTITDQKSGKPVQQAHVYIYTPTQIIEPMQYFWFLFEGVSGSGVTDNSGVAIVKMDRVHKDALLGFNVTVGNERYHNSRLGGVHPHVTGKVSKLQVTGYPENGNSDRIPHHIDVLIEPIETDK